MLGGIGELPVSSLDDPQADAELAIRLLRQESRTVQAEGWHFNTEFSLRLSPSTSGDIPLPAGTLRVRSTGASGDHDVTNRNGRLYDRRRSTFTLSCPVEVHLTTLLPFDELPEEARTYIKVRAGRKFLARTLGSQDTVGWAASDEKAARAALEVEEESNANRSIFENPAYQRLMPQRTPSPWG